MKQLEEYHFMHLDEETQQDPYPFFSLLREQRPVFREPDFGVYLISLYRDIIEVNRNSDSFSNIVAPTGPLAPIPAPIDELPRWRANSAWSEKLLTNDPPDHARYRSLINRLFVPRRIAHLEPRIRQHVAALIDEFIDRGEVEFVSEFAHLLPIVVVGELLGVPSNDVEMFKQLFHEQFSNMDESFVANPKAGSRRPANPAEDRYRSRLLSYFHEYVMERRRQPRDDVMSELANARFENGEEVPIETVVSMCQLLFAAGGDANTPEMLVNGMRLLAERPDLAGILRGSPQLTPKFVEELLRWETTAMGLFRMARVDTEVGGVAIPKGAIVMVLYASGNHDQERFENGDEFDLFREVRPNLSFGYGAHHCPGAPIARLEGKVAFEEILRRLGSIRLTDGVGLEPLPSVILRSWRQLPVTFERI